MDSAATTDDVTKVAGYRLPQQARQDTGSRLDGLDVDSVVTLRNTLNVPFRVLFGRTVVAPPRESEADRQKRLRMTELGVPTAKQGGTVDHVQDTVTIPAGQTMRLPGNIAQIAVRQMVTWILQARNQRKKVADVYARRMVEDELIVSVVTNSIEEMNQRDEQAEIAKLNPQASQEAQLDQTTPKPAPKVATKVTKTT